MQQRAALALQTHEPIGGAARKRSSVAEKFRKFLPETDVVLQHSRDLTDDSMVLPRQAYGDWRRLHLQLLKDGPPQHTPAASAHVYARTRPASRMEEAMHAACTGCARVHEVWLYAYAPGGVYAAPSVYAPYTPAKAGGRWYAEYACVRVVHATPRFASCLQAAFRKPSKLLI